MLSLLPAQALAAEAEPDGAQTPPLAEDGVEAAAVEEYTPGDEPLEDAPVEAGPVPAPQASADWVEYPAEGGNIYFDPTTGEIADCDEKVTGTVIPSSINGVTVTGIKGSAFFYCKYRNYSVVHLVVKTLPAQYIVVFSPLWELFGCRYAHQKRHCFQKHPVIIR